MVGMSGFQEKLLFSNKMAMKLYKKGSKNAVQYN